MSVVAAFAVPHPPLIVPGVGHGREKDIAATVAAYGEVARRVADLAPDTLQENPLPEPELPQQELPAPDVPEGDAPEAGQTTTPDAQPAAPQQEKP